MNSPSLFDSGAKTASFNGATKAVENNNNEKIKCAVTRGDISTANKLRSELRLISI